MKVSFFSSLFLLSDYFKLLSNAAMKMLLPDQSYHLSPKVSYISTLQQSAIKPLKLEDTAAWKDPYAMLLTVCSSGKMSCFQS